MSSPDDLLELASSIGDGHSLEGSVFAGAAPPDADPAVLRELGVIARIAAAHRAAAREPIAPPAPGDQWNWGPLVVKERLGAGSFGTVHRAHDPNLQRDVALKLYRSSSATSGSLKVLFGEGRLLARVRHPNVVVVHGIEQHGDEVGLWLELIDGRTLAEEVRSTGPLGFREAALVGLDVCRALGAVHQAGLVHRDVKAQNVMRERGGRIVLMDFGISRALDAASLEPEPSGTPLYMAPELFAGGRASVATDVYSVGVLLYFLVTASFPVVATGRARLEQSHRDGQRRLLRDARPDLPDPFADVIDRACATNPGDRYATLGAMQAALAAAAGASSGGLERSAGRSVDGPSWWAGRAFASCIAAALVLAAVAGATMLWKRSAAGVPASVSTGASQMSAPVADSQYQIQAEFRRAVATGEQVLSAGTRVAPGDRLFVEVQATRAVHLYIVNQDDRGESYLLFPLPGQSVANPLTADQAHRIPGRNGGEAVYWQVTSAGGREHFLIVASPEPLAPLEAVFATLPKPEVGRPIMTAAPLAADTVGRLRGIGGLTTKPSAPEPGGSLLRSMVALSPGLQSATGPWMRQFTLENPGR